MTATATPTSVNSSIEELRRAAADARDRAYAPYSKFDAGAAVRTTSGAVVTGSVVENISLGLAMCAERAALFSTVASGHRPSELLLWAPPTGDDVTMPCGACCQVALELGGPDLMVHSVHGKTGEGDLEIVSARLGDLLPRGPYNGTKD
ncbi:MAG: cytidine deaminase [Acidimicrobiales bacterium]